jgi:gliding motility-associated-like protein
MKKIALFVTILLETTLRMNAQDVSTYAGAAGVSGSSDGSASTAKFNSPHGICADKQGNVFIADRYNNKIRKISATGIVSTLAGSGAAGSNDGTGIAATFNEPWAVACDGFGNLYVADTKSYKIRKITAAGVVTTLAGTGTFGTTNGSALTAQFGFPAGIAVTNDGSMIYVADRMTHVIRLIQAGTVSTLAGTVYINGSTDGQGTAAKFDHPYAICIDVSGNILVTDEWNNKIRKVTPAGLVSTLAGTGSAGSANGNANASTFDAPWGIAIDTVNNIYVGDGNNYTIRRITPAGIVSTYAGIAGTSGVINGVVSSATFGGVTSLAYYKTTKSLFVGDAYNQVIRRIAPATSVTMTVTTNSSNNTFCAGASVILTASPAGLTGYTFKEGAATLGTSPTGVLTLSSLSIGAHSIVCTAVDNLGLPVTSSPISVTITATITASVVPAGPISLCQGDSTLLTASAGATYRWSTGATTQNIYAKLTGTYIVTVTASGGCSAQSTPVSVTLKPVPVSVQTANDTVCPLQPGQINVVPQTGISYYWYSQPTGGIQLFTGSSFTSPPVSQTTPYYIELHSSNGCINRSRFTVYVIMSQQPVTSFDVSLPSVVSNGIEVYFYNSTTGGYQYEWNFGDSLSTENISTLENPVHTYPNTGEYNVTLIATNQKGCTDTLYKRISVEHNFSIFIPTTFTPNNDGTNDIFRVRGSNIKSVAMNIFNSWGQLIYQSDENKWDGTVKGDIVQNGTYVYIVDVTYANATSEKFKGQITVIR